jgi:hypothetical protein
MAKLNLTHVDTTKTNPLASLRNLVRLLSHCVLRLEASRVERRSAIAATESEPTARKCLQLNTQEKLTP